ncbi:MAG: DUF2339 domain-containing protein [Haliscomenobacter sp.]|uniref:DUF2339 domain-containing protein n=1 Tax=Haliscomenobacter sp. TaxID=2717303 RepID=UPI0029A3A43C|nr:DUF2339 domain-containing protein [Haliscomenobacter sp.]MDX2070587.1 DUF2339 domain-containing protein [Haliscomenobacter sp.]
MTENQPQLQQLLTKLEQLLQKQDSFAKEIEALRQEIEVLKKESIVRPASVQFSRGPISPSLVNKPIQTIEERPLTSTAQANSSFDNKLESFIGENLISKIGIIVLVLGVAIGVKYVIDHNLISPPIRIALGYLVGIGLMGFAIRFRAQYVDYSAVLLSGAATIFYFTTYAAYSFYHLFPLTLTFFLMFAFTAFTVLASLYYINVFIALLGLVGAYALPYLLGQEPERIGTLFAYTAFVNVGILFIGLSRNWKILNVAAFFWSWLIYVAWFLIHFRPSQHFGLALGFLTLFFFLFYAILLAYQLNKTEFLSGGDQVLLISNALLFFTLGIAAMDLRFDGDAFSGLVAFINSIIHALVALVLFQLKPKLYKTSQFLACLSLAFLTIAVPLQFDGNWVTILWSLEAIALFVLGRFFNIKFLEVFSFLAMGLSCFALANGWIYFYEGSVPEFPETHIPFLLNFNFFTSLFCCGVFAGAIFFHHQFLAQSPWVEDTDQNKLLSSLLGSALLIALYFTFFCEISTYWTQVYDHAFMQSKILSLDPASVYNLEDLGLFRGIWLINYSLFFIALLSLVNWFKIKSKGLTSLGLGLNIAVLLIFLILGLTLLNDLQDSYWHPKNAFYHSTFNIGIRYVSLLFVALLLGSGIPYLQEPNLSQEVRSAYEIVVHASILWIGSNEIILLNTTLANKLGLSLLWGCYALGLIILGIWKRKPHLRISGIFLFGATLLKLFFYDIEHLATIPKTIIFVVLGMLLLLVSYLYNRYKLWLNPDQEATNLSPDHQKSSHSDNE